MEESKGEVVGKKRQDKGLDKSKMFEEKLTKV